MHSGRLQVMQQGKVTPYAIEGMRLSSGWLYAAEGKEVTLCPSQA